MISLRTLVLCLMAFLSVAVLSQAATWTTIDYPGAHQTIGVTGINSQGQMVGTYLDSVLNSHGFLDDNGIFTSIDYPGASASWAGGINDSGQIVGFYYDAAGNSRGFFYDGQNFTTIEPPGAVWSSLAKINNFAQMVGTYLDQSDFMHGYVYDLNTGSFTIVNAPHTHSQFGTGYGINNEGDIVGALSDGRGFSLSAGTYRLVAYPGASYTSPQALNDSRVVVGFIFSSKRTRAFIFSHGNYARLNYPGAKFTEAWGINNAGAIVGEYLDAAHTPHGFLTTP